MSVKILNTYWQYYDTGISRVQIRCHMVVDTVSNLPGIDDISGFRLTVGSTADVIDTAAKYRLNFDGNWYVQQQGTDFYTRAQIDSMMAAKQDLLTFDAVPVQDSTNPVYSGGVFYPIQQALADLVVDLPGKNRLQNNAVSAQVPSGSPEVDFVVNADGSISATILQTVTAARSINWNSTCPAGDWYFSIGQPLSGTSPAPCFAYLRYAGATIARDYDGEHLFSMAATDTVQCYIQFRTSAVVGETYDFYPMICRKIEYDISPKYIPYQ